MKILPSFIWLQALVESIGFILLCLILLFIKYSTHLISLGWFSEVLFFEHPLLLKSRVSEVSGSHCMTTCILALQSTHYAHFVCFSYVHFISVVKTVQSQNMGAVTCFLT